MKEVPMRTQALILVSGKVQEIPVEHQVVIFDFRCFDAEKGKYLGGNSARSRCHVGYCDLFWDIAVVF